MEEEINNNNINSQNQLIDSNNNKTKEDKSNIQQIKQLVDSLGYSLIDINRLDYYSNTIPLGAFCNAVAFILYGFEQCHVFHNQNFLEGVLLIFGGIGQITTGLLEFIKARAFPSSLYFTYGFFCLSLYIIKINLFKLDKAKADMSAFYGAWMIISIPITISSIKINFFYILQTFLTTAFFVIEVIGEGFDEIKLRENTGGIILSIAGFISLYIFLTQIINESMKFPLLPAIPIKPNNEVDITQDYRGDFVTTK
jgi:succinate-acetate transporter protein